MKKPKVSGIVGTILMWSGSYQCMMLVSLLLSVLFPQTFQAVGDSMNSFALGLPFLGSVLVIALVPAISEEILHRGILQYTLQPLEKKWLIIVLMGIYFGVFHLSLIRFLPMMFLGMVIAWLRQESGAIIYGILFHFINNFYSLAVTFVGTQVSGNVSVQELSIPVYVFGHYTLMAGAGVLILYLGSWMVTQSVTGHKTPLFSRSTKGIVAVITMAAGLAVLGVVLLAAGIFAAL